jgi:hypothetical protein
LLAHTAGCCQQDNLLLGQDILLPEHGHGNPALLLIGAIPDPYKYPIAATL